MNNSWKPLSPPLNPPADFHSSYLSIPEYKEGNDTVLHGGWKLTNDIYKGVANHPGAVVISEESPRLILFRNFLSEGEVQHLIGVSKASLTRSEVVTSEESGGTDDHSSVNDYRTSYGAWPARDDVIDTIERRLHSLLLIPKQFGEDIYCLNYKPGQKYSAHNDHCEDSNEDGIVADDACRSFLQRAGGPECGLGKGGATCGDRVATFIMYLKAPKPGSGGRTVFPQADKTMEKLNGDDVARYVQEEGDDWYCKHDDEVLGLAPSAGDAAFFWNYSPLSDDEDDDDDDSGHYDREGNGRGSFEDGTAKPGARAVVESMHGGCPTTDGEERWIATRWIRASEFL